jgi:hypothetical protein
MLTVFFSCSVMKLFLYVGKIVKSQLSCSVASVQYLKMSLTNKCFIAECILINEYRIRDLTFLSACSAAQKKLPSIKATYKSFVNLCRKS